MRTLFVNILDIKVFRNNNNNEFKQPTDIISTELVPGDLFVISDNMKLPCDCVLISGEVLLNE